MLRRLPAAVMAALFIFGAIAAPAPARASATQAPIAPEPFDSLTVRFAYNTSVGTALSDDGKTRQIELRPGQDAETALAAWEQAPGVVGVIPDIQAFPLIDPIDPLYASQWDMHEPTSGKEGAANVSPTWGTSTGAGVIVAVIDTGQTNHPDLIANMPEGWGVDMINDISNARDGDGRDTNPNDEGDWYSYTYEGETYWKYSSWHGTHVAGIIGAAQNGIGISGIAPNVSIQHVRVCGPYGCAYVDIVDGIRWAAGLTTNWELRPWSDFGLSNNAHPADIINLSLGGGGSCWAPLQDAISQAHAAGTVVVTAAGNSFLDAANFNPANCNDTVTVAATGRSGRLSYYSNFGSTIDIAAPGGDMPRDSGIISTIATGATALTGYGYTNYQGTSMSAPHVAGVAALVASLYPTWGPSEIEAAIYAAVRPFPIDSLRPCVTTSETPTESQRQCGAGLLDAAGAFNDTPQSINFGAGPLLTSADVPFGTTPPALTATASSGLRVSYEISTPTVCEALAPDSLVNAWRLRLLNLGTCTVLATQPGDAVYERATAVERNFTIVRGSQTIGLGAVTDRVFNPMVAQVLPRFSSAGLPLNYAGLSSSVCDPQFNGTNFELKVFRPGTCTIFAEQAGTSTYHPADSVTRTFEVFRLTQNPLIFQVGSAYQAVNSSSGYGNGGGSTAAPFVATSLTRTICTVSGRTIRYLKVGTCILQGRKDGDALHQPISETIRITVFVPARVTVAPRISQIGKIVYGTRGTWAGSPAPSFKYQWYSCSSAPRTSCTPISGATSVNLTVTNTVAGKYAFLRVFMYQAGYERARTDSNSIKLSAK